MTDFPDGLILKLDWISPPAAEKLVAWIDDQEWDLSLRRRTQHYGYRFDYSQKRSGTDLQLGPLPEILADLSARIAGELEIPLFDQVIVNEYAPGQGIGPHVDDLRSFGPVVASLSLISAAVMQFSHDDGRSVDADLPPRSLVCMTGPARDEWRHGIAPREEDATESGSRARGRRVSVTLRQMLHSTD